MAVNKTSARQWVLSTGFIEVSFADLPPGEAVELVDLPAGATVIGGEIVVDAVFNGGGAETVVIGDSLVANRYGNAVALGSLARTALTLTGFTYTEPNSVRVVRTANAVGTAGGARLRVEYVIQGRSNENQGRGEEGV
jgi:hypothetical protein